MTHEIARQLCAELAAAHDTGIRLSGFFWALYSALEPVVRELWPQSIISRTRLVAGRLRDPLIGRDSLFGMVAGLGLSILERVIYLSAGWLGNPSSTPGSPNLDLLLGTRFAFSRLPIQHTGAALGAMSLMVVLIIARKALRIEWPAYVVFGLALSFTTPIGASSGVAWIDYIVDLSATALLVYLLVRLGLMETVAGFFAFGFMLAFPASLDFTAWWSGSTTFALVTIASIAAYAAWCATRVPSPASKAETTP